MEKHPKPNVCRNMVGISAASVAGFLFMASPAHEALAADNPFVQQFGQDNPLAAPVLVDQYSKPAMVDIDNDGDMDLFVGEAYGRFLFFENMEVEGGAGGGTTPVVTDDDDTCFINSLSTAGKTKAEISPLKRVKNLCASLVSFLR